MEQNKYIPILWIAILFILIVELIYTVYSYIDYNSRKESGNERWKQVEERIQRLEEEHGRVCKSSC
ncbi:MAG TPA: hypothetical protein IAD49_03730 [Candidatus Fimihabitans intestinipullorum]|uniref:Uncharacterized protein n=1 Tax=Candidatus Fimihabitans intestinipullorum TaxID=2840820 RepID=A0A9D1L475_9BACT|nr:hypothetical protein [Candidatus Fimihabitans intestinipullorum]